MEREKEAHGDEPLYSSFVCPVSLQVMSDPVIIIETHQTVDRASACAWFDRGHRSCPVTGKQLTSIQLIPNYGLRHAIEEWLARKRRKWDVDSDDHNAAAAAAAPPRSCTQREQLVRESAAAAARAECRFIEEVIARARSQGGRDALVSQRERLVPRLVSLLRASQVALQLSAAEALTRLSLDSSWQQCITEAPDTLPTIINILQTPSLNELHPRVLELLTQLTFDNDEAKISITVIALLTILTRLLHVPECQLAAARVASNLAGSDIARICVADLNMNVVTTCVELLRPEHDGDIHEAAIRLLRRLATHEDIRRSLNVMSSLKVRLQALAHTSATSVQQGSALLLDTLAGRSSDVGMLNMQDYFATLMHEQHAVAEEDVCPAFDWRPSEGLFEFCMGRADPAQGQQRRRRRSQAADKRRARRRQQIATTS